MIKIPCLLIVPGLFISICACQNPERGNTNRSQSRLQSDSISWNQPFIPVDSADTMIKSYLISINYQSADSNVRSFIIDANALRQYLTVGQGAQITNMKVMLAHNNSYIQAGNFGQPCGYSNEGLTVVLAGFGADGNYIYAPGNKVMDYSMPCPENCPRTGTASRDLMPN